MGVPKELGWTFDTAASEYEKRRPGYVDELYRTIFDYCRLDASSRAVEVGIGGGQATLPILKTGCSVTAAEPGEHLCTLCREKFRDYPGFSAMTGKFEELPFGENEYDLVYSAAAFHWIEEKTGYTKVYSMLKEGGAFARFANHPFRCKGNPEQSEAIDEAYAAYYDRFYHTTSAKPDEYTEEDAARRAAVAERYGFRDIRWEVFHRTRELTAREYAQLLGTYSDHIAMDEDVRVPFLEKIEEAIERTGGTIVLYDTMDLELARK